MSCVRNSSRNPRNESDIQGDDREPVLLELPPLCGSQLLLPSIRAGAAMNKQDLGLILDRPIAFHRVFVSLTGSITAAVMLSQALYWHTRSKGEWWKTQEEWFEECGLSRSELESARKKLISIGVLSHERKGLPARSFYRVHVEKLAELLPACRKPAIKDDNETGSNQDSGKHAGQFAENLQSGQQESCNHLKITENTTETTTENKKHTPTRQRTEPQQADSFQAPVWLDQETWQGFVDYRKSIKAPLTNHAKRLAVKKLDQLRQQGHDPHEVIEQTILSGKWTGLFPVNGGQRNEPGYERPRPQSLVERVRANGEKYVRDAEARRAAHSTVVGPDDNDIRLPLDGTVRRG